MFSLDLQGQIRAQNQGQKVIAPKQAFSEIFFTEKNPSAVSFKMIPNFFNYP